MPNRLQELLQQRALIKDHLAWLEEEIAAARGQPTTRDRPEISPAPTISPIVIPTATEILKRGTNSGLPLRPARDEADALLAKLAAEEPKITPPDKKGCWFVFAAVLLVGTVGVWLVVHQFYR